MFGKTCARCDKRATVELAGKVYCTGHAFDLIVTSKGPVQQPRSLR